MARGGKVTPAAPNPLTKLRRLADLGLLGNFSGSFSLGAMWLLLPGDRPSQRAARPPVTFWPLACNLRGRACRFPVSSTRIAAYIFIILAMFCVGIRK